MHIVFIQDVFLIYSLKILATFLGYIQYALEEIGTGLHPDRWLLLALPFINSINLENSFNFSKLFILLISKLRITSDIILGILQGLYKLNESDMYIICYTDVSYYYLYKFSRF